MIHPVIENLKRLRLNGVVEALECQLKNPESKNLLFEERLALLIDNEIGIRERKRLQARLKKAKLKHQAYMPDVTYVKSYLARNAIREPYRIKFLL